MNDPTDEQMRELAEWIGGMPPNVVAVMDRFPPAAYVQAKDGRRLIVPAPGERGTISTYLEHDDGTVSIRVEGQLFDGDCDPERLEVIDSEEQFTLYARAKEMAASRAS